MWGVHCKESKERDQLGDYYCSPGGRWRWLRMRWQENIERMEVEGSSVHILGEEWSELWWYIILINFLKKPSNLPYFWKHLKLSVFLKTEKLRHLCRVPEQTDRGLRVSIWAWEILLHLIYIIIKLKYRVLEIVLNIEFV